MNGVAPPAVQHLTARSHREQREISGAGAMGHAEGGEGCELPAWPDRGSGRRQSAAGQAQQGQQKPHTTWQLALGNYSLTVRQ
ncbi:hypothetical protein ACNKHN_10740 [Shigella flexneri]